LPTTSFFAKKNSVVAKFLEVASIPLADVLAQDAEMYKGYNKPDDLKHQTPARDRLAFHRPLRHMQPAGGVDPPVIHTRGAFPGSPGPVPVRGRSPAEA
jgi:hypothetical protein